jgi:soluble lytic murein transglycosylase-like protein
MKEASMVCFCPKKSLPLLILLCILFTAASEAVGEQDHPRRERIARRSVGGREDVIRRSYDSRVMNSLLTNSLVRALYLSRAYPLPTPAHTPSRPLPLPENKRSAPARASGIDPEILNRIASFDLHIVRQSRDSRIDPNLTRAIIYVESAGDPEATSPKGARGLMQLMPGTADLLGVRNSFDPVQNIRGGTRYLRTLLDQFHNVELALWGYNAGPGAVERKSLPAETRRYIPEVLRVKAALDRIDGKPARIRAAHMVENR